MGDAHIQSGRYWGFLEGYDIAFRQRSRRGGRFLGLIGGDTLLVGWEYAQDGRLGLFGAAGGASEYLWRQALRVRYGCYGRFWGLGCGVRFNMGLQGRVHGEFGMWCIRR